MKKNFFDTEFEILITCSFGLESVLKKELLELGYDDFEVENGRVCFVGNINDIFITNLYIRTGDRVYIRLKKFELEKEGSFDELFDQIYSISFEDILPEDANFIVNAKSVKSKLFSVRTIQSVSEKAIVNKLSKYYETKRFPKTGAKYEFEINLLKDVAQVLLDTSGIGLHKRGYRSSQGEAPIKETLAAALVMLSGWKYDRTLVDPFCGSGTIVIEAFMLANNIAPGLKRDFAFMHWKGIDIGCFEKFKKQAMDSITPSDCEILGSDIDEKVLKIAYKNLQNLGLGALERVKFIKKDFYDFDLTGGNEIIITNPPYGVRLNDIKEVEKIYKKLGEKLREYPKTSLFLITSNEEFEKNYGRKAIKKRKLYNGRIKVFYYQYF